MESTKTTTLGILTILAALINAGVSWLKTGVLPDFGALATAITAGIGLIIAKDHTAA